LNTEPRNPVVARPKPSATPRLAPEIWLEAIDDGFERCDQGGRRSDRDVDPDATFDWGAGPRTGYKVPPFVLLFGRFLMRDKVAVNGDVREHFLLAGCASLASPNQGDAQSDVVPCLLGRNDRLDACCASPQRAAVSHCVDRKAHEVVQIDPLPRRLKHEVETDFEHPKHLETDRSGHIATPESVSWRILGGLRRPLDPDEGGLDSLRPPIRFPAAAPSWRHSLDVDRHPTRRDIGDRTTGH
jgi:hypothetical protein